MKKLGFDLVLLGDPASGKDTQAKLLMKKLSLYPVESGKHWRTQAAKNTAEGKRIRETMAKGFPTPVSLMKKFLVAKISAAAKNQDIIFIGNPRLKPEAQLFTKLLKNKDRNYLVIYLRLPKNEILKRVNKRIDIEGRNDDRNVYLKNRFVYYKEQVPKTVAYFKKLKKIKFIDGNQPIAKVNSEIFKILNNYKV